MRDSCEKLVATLGDVLVAKKQLTEVMKAHVAICDSVAEKYMPGGVQTPGCEDRVDKDPAYIKAAAVVDATNVKIMAADKTISATRGSLRAALKALNDENMKFEKYVMTKKAKWLGSKNSVPAAEECVKTTKEYVKRCMELL